MNATFRILSALLCYPTRNLTAAAPEFGTMFSNDGLLTSEQIGSLIPLIDALAHDDLIDSQERYVGLFDRGRSVSLHLFEHVHGESRDRGQAMVDLQARYAAQGLDISAKELPDYLPMFLEYISLLPPDQARAELAEPGLIFAALAERLGTREPLYAAPLAILRDLAGVEAAAAAAAAASIAPAEDPDDLEALDAKWAEEQVRFDAPAAPDVDAACPQVADMIARFAAEPLKNRSSAHV
ncbi:MAG: nitrate reductase molybdenum cofactor assembly chaperone [Sphingopyxis sp.]